MRFLQIVFFLGGLVFCPQLSTAQNFVDQSSAQQFNATGSNRGIAIGDFDQDGWEDIYVSRLGAPNLLYKNEGGFVFTEVAAAYGVAGNEDSGSALWFDLENDGDLDLFVGNIFEENQLFRNDGNTFTNISADFGIQTNGNPRSLNAVDYDLDGDLDIYVAQVQAQNILWRNENGQSFTNVIAASGIDDTGKSLGAIFFDYDLDGDPDLYQTRDGADPNLFWKNNGDGTFTEVSEALGLDYVGFGMGTDIADINSDGFPDIYLTNLEENLLYLSSPGGAFAEVGSSLNVDDIGMGWSTFFFDHDNTGRQDLYLANESDFAVNGQTDIPNRLFINEGSAVYSSPDLNGNVENIFASYGAAAADFDQDGRWDIALANHGATQGNQLFQNQGTQNNFISFRLKGIESNKQGIGSRVEIQYDGKTDFDFIYAGSGYASQNSPHAHFGLNDSEAVDCAIIYWPSGNVQKILNPKINQLNEVEEKDGVEVPPGLVVWAEPFFPTQLDEVTVYFNAAEGNAALQGFSGDVYAHTGVISNFSSGPSDWQHVQGNWGTVDANVLMTKVADNIYFINYTIQDYYSISPGEEVNKLSFVFRNADGSIVGRNADGSDIFTDVYPANQGLTLSLNAPQTEHIITDEDSLFVSANINQLAEVIITDNGVEVYNQLAALVETYLYPSTVGIHEVNIQATYEMETIEVDFTYFVVSANQELMDPPVGSRPGINYVDNSYIFQLYAPTKEHVFLLCPANNFTFDADFQMNKSVDGNTFWIELPNTEFDNGRNTYQFLVDGNITIADPYSEVVLDPNNDQQVDEDVMAELPPYPANASGRVTAFDFEKVDYNWQHSGYDRPEKTDLVIYELLMRDFLGSHSYVDLLDTLDYLDRLGVNAIELMPINEFENNNSWGYNPSFHMAVDKYYGSRDQLKMVIDEAHSRGIAVILDVVFNHAFSQSPLCQLYWDNQNFRPAEDNPWLNVTPRHPFNVGYDFNHESQGTKKWVKRVLEHWIIEFQFDGFRFDLSKGMTQTNSGTNANLMAQYDASRISILKDYADFIWNLDSESYVILEHFADNSEEKELAEYGMMLWGNMTHEFAEAAMGYTSDLEWADYKVRGWSVPHAVTYMESHDEERMLYKTLLYGDDEGDYNTRELPTALRRAEAAATIFYTIPGPKMLWQFGELGYDYSINHCVNGNVDPGCRLDPKPIRWDYQEDENRARLNEVLSNIIHLRTTYPTFASTDYTFNDGNFFLKTVHLNHPEMDAAVLANFRVIDSELNPNFQYPGTWYEYFTGDSLVVVDTQEKLPLAPGEYRIYTSKRITPPNGFMTNTHEIISSSEGLDIYPNPIGAGEWIEWKNGNDKLFEGFRLIDAMGRSFALKDYRAAKVHIPAHFSPGVYLLEARTKDNLYLEKIVIGN